MGKIKKLKRNRTDPLQKRPSSLADQIESAGHAKQSGRVKEKKRQKEQEYVESSLSAKILRQAQAQQEELAEEGDFSGKRQRVALPAVKLRGPGGEESDDDQDDQEEEVEQQAQLYDYGVVDVDPEDEKAVDSFMSRDPHVRNTLADILKEKITEAQTEIRSQMSDTSETPTSLPPGVVEVYRKCSEVLAKYRSGKIPKAVKMIPHLRQWQQAALLTEPDHWSAASMYQLTRIFVSNMKPVMLQKFYALFLLPRVRDDISEYKRLNFHLYQALKKSLFKPAAFYKGIILPLCRSGNCSLREAVIISALLAKESILMLDSSVAMCKIAEMDYSGACSIFLRVLLEKKYSLPRRAVEIVAKSFLRFANDERQLPVLWHQSLLALAQHYKRDVSVETREALLTQLLPAQRHTSITPLVRQELLDIAEETAMEG